MKMLSTIHAKAALNKIRVFSITNMKEEIHLFGNIIYLTNVDAGQTSKAQIVTPSKWL
jgi:hypothetical protein